MPADPAWREGAVALASFEDGRLSRLEIQPITLEWEEAGSAGLPRVAEGTAITDRLAGLSTAWGTGFRRENGRVQVVLPRFGPGATGQ